MYLLRDDLRRGEEVRVATLREHVQDHREVGVPEEGVDLHELVVHARALPGDVVALRAQVAHARLVGGAVNRVDADVLACLRELEDVVVRIDPPGARVRGIFGRRREDARRRRP